MSAMRRSGLADRVRGSWRILLKELSAFGLVGALAFVIDFGLFTWLQPIGSLKANFISTAVSTAFAYFGNRHWSFSHRARTGLARETAYFFGINLITLAFSEAAIALFVYGFGFDHTSRVISAVKLATIAIGTAFRFWSYKRFVFLNPDRVKSGEVDLDVELAE